MRRFIVSRLPPRALRVFLRCEAGGITVLSLFLFMAMLLFGGLAVDVSNVMAARTHLQVAADSSAHAALLARQHTSAQEARQIALGIAEGNMPAGRFGNVLTAADIEFGRWDFQERQFTPDPTDLQRQAVRVNTRRVEDRNNGIATFLLKLVGLGNWNVTTPAVFSTYIHPCFREGLVAEQRVRVRSNNTFGNGFCVHSNDYVEFNNHNTFERGTVVSMPDLAMLGLPGSGFRHNEGLEAALRQGYMDMDVPAHVQRMISEMQDPDSRFMPAYITEPFPVALENLTIGEDSLEPGYVYTAMGCGSNGKLTISGDIDLTEVVILTDCRIEFGQSVRIHDAVILTSNTSSQSIHGAANVNFGRDDNCTPGGSVTVMTMGGMHFAAKLNVNGSRIVAAGDIDFAAQGAAVQGGSMVAGGEIDGTSNLEFSYCGTGMDDTMAFEHLRLVL